MARAWRFELVCRRASASSRVRRRWATFPSSRRCVLASPSRVPPRWWRRSKFHPTGRPPEISRRLDRQPPPARTAPIAADLARRPRVDACEGRGGHLGSFAREGGGRRAPSPRIRALARSTAPSRGHRRRLAFFARRADSRAFAVSSRSRRDLVAASRGASTCAAPSLRSRASTLTRSPPSDDLRAQAGAGAGASPAVVGRSSDGVAGQPSRPAPAARRPARPRRIAPPRSSRTSASSPGSPSRSWIASARRSTRTSA